MLKDWLNQRGISYRALAADMGLSPSAVCKRINGQVDWTSTDLLFLNDRYGLSSDFVLGLVPDPSKGGDAGVGCHGLTAR